MKSGLNIALVGATGALGREILTVIEDMELAFEAVTLFASESSTGTELLLKNRILSVNSLESAKWSDFDVVVFSATSAVHEAYVDAAGAAGCLIVERYFPEAGRDDGGWTIPSLMDGKLDGQCFRSPPGAATSLAPILAALQGSFGVQSLTVTSMEPASEMGQSGMVLLSHEVLNLYRSGDVEGSEELEAPESPFSDQMAFNAIPLVGPIMKDGRSQLEADIEDSLNQLVGRIDSISVSAVQVPWFSSFALTVSLTLEKPTNSEQLSRLLDGIPGVDVLDDPAEGDYPMPFDVIGQDEIRVGRIRAIGASGRQFAFFAVSDNLRTASAFNLVNILGALSSNEEN